MRSIRNTIGDSATPFGAWWLDFISIAKGLGYNPANWVQALSDWAEHNGIQSTRSLLDVILIARSTGHNPENWKQALRMIAAGDPPAPPNTRFFLDTPPRQPNTIYRVLADGIITANQTIMA